MLKSGQQLQHILCFTILPFLIFKLQYGCVYRSFCKFCGSSCRRQGKAQANSLKKTREFIIARKLDGKKEIKISGIDLVKGDFVICEAGDIIPADGDVIEGIASVDESAITGESAPVIRESGGDRSAVTGGTKVISDRIIIKITSEPGHSFMDKLIELVEGAKRQKTPNRNCINNNACRFNVNFSSCRCNAAFIFQLCFKCIR